MKSQHINDLFLEIKKSKKVDIVNEFNLIDTTQYSSCYQFNYIKMRCDTLSDKDNYRIFYKNNKIKMVEFNDIETSIKNYYLNILNLNDSISIFTRIYINTFKDDNGDRYNALINNEGIFINYKSKKIYYLEPSITCLIKGETFYNFFGYDFDLYNKKIKFKIEFNYDFLHYKNIKFYYDYNENLEPIKSLFLNSSKFIIKKDCGCGREIQKTEKIPELLNLINEQNLILSDEYKDKDITLSELDEIFSKITNQKITEQTQKKYIIE